MLNEDKIIKNITDKKIDVRQQIDFVNRLSRKVKSKYNVSDVVAKRLVEKTSNYHVKDEDDVFYVIETQLLKRRK